MRASSRQLEERFNKSASQINLAPGDMLFRNGDPTRGMFLLKSGSIRLIRHSHEGREVTLHAVRPGETFAEPSLFAQSYHCDCICDTAASVLLYSQDQMLRELETDAGFATLFASRLAGQVRDLRAQLELRNILSSEERIMNALTLRLTGNENRVELGTTLKAFASEIGITHENLYRTMSRMEAGGRLRRNGCDIVLL